MVGERIGVWEVAVDADHENLAEARSELEVLRGNLCSVIDPRDISAIAKTPCNVARYREGLGWRTEEVARCACDHFERGDLAAGIILTRSVAESAASAWHLKELTEKQASDGLQADFDEKIKTLLMGQRCYADEPKAINILTLVGRLNNEVEGFSDTYDHLSEVAHPNWAGTQHLYSKWDAEKVVARFGRDVRTSDVYEKAGPACLFASLIIFNTAYDAVTDAMPSLIKLCEEELASKK